MFVVDCEMLLVNWIEFVFGVCDDCGGLMWLVMMCVCDWGVVLVLMGCVEVLCWLYVWGWWLIGKIRGVIERAMVRTRGEESAEKLVMIVLVDIVVVIEMIKKVYMKKELKKCKVEFDVRVLLSKR